MDNTCGDGSTAFPQGSGQSYQLKVEFGEGEGKVPFDKITERAEKYKPKERVTYKKINSVSKYILHI